MQAGPARLPDHELARATTTLGEDLCLRTGARPERSRVLAGRARGHRIALCWPASTRPRVCVQVLELGAAGSTHLGWLPGEATALGEASDLRAGASPELRPAYHLVLLDPASSGRDSSELSRRCAALEADHLDGAGWLRPHGTGHLAEGTFVRVLERAAADIRRIPDEHRAGPGWSGFC